MPLIEYGCFNCRKVSEILIKDRHSIPDKTTCDHCSSEDTARLISKVHFKTYKRPKYDDDFLGKAMPAMMKKKETAQYFAEGPRSSDEAKMFDMGEQIGEKMDQVIERSIPPKR